MFLKARECRWIAGAPNNAPPPPPEGYIDGIGGGAILDFLAFSMVSKNNLKAYPDCLVFFKGNSIEVAKF